MSQILEIENLDKWHVRMFAVFFSTSPTFLEDKIDSLFTVCLEKNKNKTL